ncbi:MAG: pyridoxamine 5'-phosphate oxidase family protein [Eggerthellaceae bacterium]
MAFREMRRKKQALSEEETWAILENGTECVLALAGDDGFPYAVPVNYACESGKLYFHGALAGHKHDALRACQKLSLCVIERNDLVPEKLTTAYRSVIAFGTARLLEDPDEILHACMVLGMRFNPDGAFVESEVRGALSRTCCVEVTIEHITGKEGLELVKLRE